MAELSPDTGGLAIKVAGALSGVVFVDSLESTVGSLRAEISRLLGGSDARGVKIIVGGRTLQDDSKTLAQAGVSPSSRLLVTRGAADPGAAAVNAAAERAARLAAVRQAAEALAGRDARGLTDNYALDIENQFGGSVAVKPEDRRNLVLGLVLHDKARDTLRRGDYGAALDELLVAEEALALCDPQLTAAVDNVPLLLIDLVWCCYKLGDTRRLAVSRERLKRAREGLARAHGPNLERLRGLTGSAFTPELATYLRLEVLEGLAAYHGGEPRATAEACLRAAQAKWQRLQVSDESLAMLQSMGYRLQESRRGLRFSGGDVATAVDFIERQRAAKEDRAALRRKQEAWRAERTAYGKTSSGAYVDEQQLDGLVGLGYARALAAEALRKHDNAGQAALDELSVPERRRALELELVLREGLKEAEKAAAAAKEEKERAEAEAAAAAADAAEAGAGAGGSGGEAAASGDGPSTSTGGGGVGAASDAALEALKAVAQALGAARAAEQGAGGRRAKRGRGDGEEDAMEGVEGGEGQGEEGEQEEEQDEEVRQAERELVRHVQDDPMAAYDIDVSEEGDVIATYLTLLNTSQQQQQQQQ